MHSESEVLEDPKDRTRWWWLVVGVLFIGVVVALWMQGRAKGDVSQVRAKHILVKFNQGDAVDRGRALELIQGLRTRIQNGESFSKLAKEFSNDEYSAARGGDLGYYKKGSFEGNFETYVWSGPEGELSDIVQTSHGFHLIIIMDRHLSKADQYDMELEKKAKENAAESPPAPAPANP